MPTKHIIFSKYRQHTLCIILISVAIRLIGVDQPLLEGAILRQIQTAEISYNLFSDGFDLLHPQIHVLPEPRYFILEFPIYSSIIALLYKLFGVHEVFGRVIFFCEERKDEKKKDERRKTDDDAMDIIKTWRRRVF